MGPETAKLYGELGAAPVSNTPPKFVASLWAERNR
jgi:hypothetical protein